MGLTRSLPWASVSPMHHFTGTATDALTTITAAQSLALIFFVAVALMGPVLAELLDSGRKSVAEIHPAQALAVECTAAWAEKAAEKDYAQDADERRTWEQNR